MKNKIRSSVKWKIYFLGGQKNKGYPGDPLPWMTNNFNIWFSSRDHIGASQKARTPKCLNKVTHFKCFWNLGYKSNHPTPPPPKWTTGLKQTFVLSPEGHFCTPCTWTYTKNFIKIWPHLLPNVPTDGRSSAISCKIRFHIDYSLHRGKSIILNTFLLAHYICQ